MLQQGFEKAIGDSKWLINYVWVCPKESLAHKTGNATRLPLHYFERVYENAEKYPEASFTLWVDFSQLSILDRFFLDSHRYLFDKNKVSVCNLRDIPEYHQASEFDVDTNIAVYARADCARILVLKHLLNNVANTTVVYSDIDCLDVKANDVALNHALEKYGVAHGVSGKNCEANGYIALRGEKGKTFMDSYLYSKTMDDFLKNKVNHYGAFVRSVRKYRRENYPDQKSESWGFVELPLMRTLIPYNASRYDGVCSPREARVPGSIDLT